MQDFLQTPLDSNEKSRFNNDLFFKLLQYFYYSKTLFLLFNFTLITLRVQKVFFPMDLNLYLDRRWPFQVSVGLLRADISLVLMS